MQLAEKCDAPQLGKACASPFRYSVIYLFINPVAAGRLLQRAAAGHGVRVSLSSIRITNPDARGRPGRLKCVILLQLAENYDAPQLGKACVLFALEHYKDMAAAHAGQSGALHGLMSRMVTVLTSSLTETLVTNAMAPAAPPAPGPSM